MGKERPTRTLPDVWITVIPARFPFQDDSIINKFVLRSLEGILRMPSIYVHSKWRK